MKVSAVRRRRRAGTPSGAVMGGVVGVGFEGASECETSSSPSATEVAAVDANDSAVDNVAIDVVVV